MHTTRVITSIIGVIALIAIIGQGNLLVFWLVVSCATVVGLLEFYTIVQARKLPVYRLPGVLLGWLLSLNFLLVSTFENKLLTNFTITLLVLALLLYALLTKRSLADSIPALASTLLGIFYVSWLFSHLILLYDFKYGREFIFYLLLVVWSGDTGAYYCGKAFGKHRLAPVISPKKTIEGSIGGTVASLAASCIAKWTFLPLLGYKDCVFLGLGLAIIAQLGDLCESMIKRGADVKDSGTILPGHGGILDRVDGVLCAAPVLYYYSLVFLVM
ncbi:phosphatidate cytidylyltransferase [candidate division KSB3 bacterium]|uniref:Phosphatidate cytidylyltransferase n=1 Tax=candidate division KSB3 bacterium TaxID=2044937 RepID=A0A2G6K753_9BACT|nr:MAG: phosphatidate cytidylyltransferase [candidate division KSB3 bacterium]